MEKHLKANYPPRSFNPVSESFSDSRVRWTVDNWNDPSLDDSSDGEDHLDLAQPHPIFGNCTDAPADEGRGARPSLTARSSANDFQDAFDQQQTFWARKWCSKPESDFQVKIRECAEVQAWLNSAIEKNELSIEAIQWVATSCGTKFLEALGYIQIVEGLSGRSIQWTNELREAFSDAGILYADSSRKAFLGSQASSIAMSTGNVLLEISKVAIPGAIVDRIKMGIKSAQLCWQIFATPYFPLCSAHAQPKGVKAQELSGIPYMPAVSSIEYKEPVVSASGTKTLETRPYPNAKDIRWSLDLIEKAHGACSLNKRNEVKTYLVELGYLRDKLKTKVERLEKKEEGRRLSGGEQYKLRLAKQRLALIALCTARCRSPEKKKYQRGLLAAEGALKKEAALSRIANGFNAAPASSKVRAARYGFFSVQAMTSFAGPSARLGHCIPYSVREVASSAVNNVTRAGSQIAEMVTAGNLTETMKEVETCTGFNPWGLALEVVNFGLTIANPIRYWWSLPQACAEDYMSKVGAYAAALMLQPHGQLIHEKNEVDPEVFGVMLRGRMWRVLDCVSKTLESDLHCPASALMTHIVDVAEIPSDEPYPYKYFLLQFEALKTPQERQEFMRAKLASGRREIPASVDLLLKQYEQAIEAIQLVKNGEVSALLDDHRLPLQTLDLLRSGLTIAAGGSVTEADEANWNVLLKIFGDVEASSKKTDQEVQKLAQGLAKKGVAGTSGFTLIKNLIDLTANVAKIQSELEHDMADIIAKSIQLLGSTTALGSASAGYLVSYCYWQFILEKNRQRQAKLNDKFSPPNSSLLNPDSDSFMRFPNLDRFRGVVRNFRTLLAFPIDDALINKNVTLRFDTNESTFWSDTWAQINTIDLNLNVRNLCSRLAAIVHPEEVLLDTHADEVTKIIRNAKNDLIGQLEQHIADQKNGVGLTTTVNLADFFLDTLNRSSDDERVSPGQAAEVVAEPSGIADASGELLSDV